MIKNCDNSDAGVYTVTASNKNGRVETKAELIIAHPPTVISKLKESSVVLKKTILMETEVHSSPAAKIMWYKDEVLLDEEYIRLSENRISIVERLGGFCQILIKNSKEEDRGLYKCIAMNKYGEASTSAYLEVYTPPVFKQKLEKIEAVENCEAELLVEVNGTPDPKIIWYKGSQEIDLNNHLRYKTIKEGCCYSLIIHSIENKDSGQYQCVATNEAGRASCMGNLTIYPLTAPVIITGLNSTVLVAENSYLELSIKVTGIPIPKFTWTKDNEVLELNNEYSFSRNLSNGIYTLKSQTSGKHLSGKYKVTAQNPGGIAESEGIVIVQGFAPYFTDKPEKIICFQGTTAALGCIVKGDPQPLMTWSLKNKELQNNDNKYHSYYDEILDAYFLEIKNVANSDKGTYQASAKNQHGESHAAVTLMITDKQDEAVDYKSMLRRTLLQKFMNEEETEEIRLKKARLNEKEIEDNSLKYKLRHVVKEVNVEQEPESAQSMDSKQKKGLRTIMRDNHGKEYLEDGITVETIKPDEPQFEEEPKDQMILKDKEAKFACVVKSLSKLTVTWFFNGKQIQNRDGFRIEKDKSNAEKHHLIISRVNMDGEIKVKATNDSGSTEAACNLSVADVPKALNKIENVTVNENETAKMTVRFSGHPKPRIRWFKNDDEIFHGELSEITETNENEVSINIISCKNEKDSGNYYAKISNDFGEVETNKATLTIKSNS